MKHPEHIPAPVTIQCIQDPDQKQCIARDVLEALPDWFGIAESREAYIRGSRDQTMFAANCGGAFSGFLCLKPTGNATVELAVMGIKKPFHRQGIGTLLFRAARDHAESAGFAFMQVKTVAAGHYEDYDRTNRFYQSLGFQELEVLPELWDAANPCQIYILSLKERASLTDLILRRHSYRGRFLPDRIPRQDLNLILEAGLAAPSGCNKQTTSLIAVDDPGMLEKIHAVIDPPVGETAPAMICVLSQKIYAYRDRCFAVQDYSAAIENMLLAITALGYQSCWYEGHITDTDRICDRIADILGVPPEYDLVCMLPVGVAESKPAAPRKKPFEERAFFNGFRTENA